ncbi:hypothetical protein PIROE2DRAFT_60240 [Piromyces sp. E2]|nr:hypothetical protein PIROE2DRAFT_60240 [Piromyces sp. E2]|eukprot:OUM65138.1 hypothetical protein PIROE2DRAFT_60240 [Piromyces sp. E2]
MPLDNRGYIEYPDNRPVIKAANALKWHSEKIPEERKAHLFKTINDFFETRKMARRMTKEDMIEQALILPTLEKSDKFLEHGEYVVKQILSISREDNHCRCLLQTCPCKESKDKKEKSITKTEKDTTTNSNTEDIEKKKEDEDSILLHYSPSETDPENPNSSSIETDLKIIDAYVNRCCGDSCHCQCQRLPMPEKIIKETYKPEGFELPSLPVNNENQCNGETPSSSKNSMDSQKDCEEVSPLSSHSEVERKSDKDLTPEEKENKKMICWNVL